MLNCAWQNLYWWHGFTCCCGGRDDYLGVGTSSAGSSGDGVVCRNHSLMAGWGHAGGQSQNELPYAVLSVCLCPGRETTTSISIPLLLTAPSRVSPSIPLSCVKPQDLGSSRFNVFLKTVALQKFRWCSSRAFPPGADSRRQTEWLTSDQLLLSAESESTKWNKVSGFLFSWYTERKNCVHYSCGAERNNL